MNQMTEQMRANLEEMKRKKVDCFKMCFRIKVRDAIEYATAVDKDNLNLSSSQERQGPSFDRSYIISFIMTGPQMYEAIQEGYRYRFFNVKPECFYRDSFRIKE